MAGRGAGRRAPGRRRAGAGALAASLLEDPLLQRGRGRRAGRRVREVRGCLTQARKLLTAALARREVLLEAALLLVVEGVEGVGGRERVQVVRHLGIVGGDWLEATHSERLPRDRRPEER